MSAMAKQKMTDKDGNAAVEALIAWFESQEISPADAVPVMAKAMVVAVASLARKTGDYDTDLADLKESVRIASEMIPEAFWKIAGERP
jgi:hypothetical protein